ncbi:MAG: hypothetical protein ACRCUZ_04005 [Shewanella sp.]
MSKFNAHCNVARQLKPSSVDTEDVVIPTALQMPRFFKLAPSLTA